MKSFSYLYWYIIRSSKKIKGPNTIRNSYHFDINEKLLFQKTWGVISVSVNHKEIRILIYIGCDVYSRANSAIFIRFLVEKNGRVFESLIIELRIKPQTDVTCGRFQNKVYVRTTLHSRLRHKEILDSCGVFAVSATNKNLFAKLSHSFPPLELHTYTGVY